MDNENIKYVRDIRNEGAVLNVDNAALKAYKLQKEKNKKIDQLEKDVNDIKNMLNLILDKMK